jgi:hypothetical protein
LAPDIEGATKLRVFENRALRRIFGSKGLEIKKAGYEIGQICNTHWEKRNA